MAKLPTEQIVRFTVDTVELRSGPRMGNRNANEDENNATLVRSFLTHAPGI